MRGFDAALVAALEYFDINGLGNFGEEGEMDGWYDWQQEDGMSFSHLI